jgi:competence protein ComEA
MRKFLLFLLFALAGAATYLLWRRRAASESAPLYELGTLSGAPPASPATDAALAAHAYDATTATLAPPAAFSTPEEPLAAPADAAQAADAPYDEPSVVAPADIAADTAMAAHTLTPDAPADVVSAAAEEASAASLAAGETVDAPIADVADAADLAAEDTTGGGYTSLMPEEVAEETAPGVATVAPDGTELPDLPDEEPAEPQLPAPGTTFDLNAATLDELISLPGIGPYLAQRIIDFRDARGGFKAVSDLLDISGIGPNNIREFEDYLTVGAPADEGASS